MDTVAGHLAQALCSLPKDEKTKVIQYILNDSDFKEAITELLITNLSITQKPLNINNPSHGPASIKIGFTSNKEKGLRVREDYISTLNDSGIQINLIDRVWAKTENNLWVGIPFATERVPGRWFLGLPEKDVLEHLKEREIAIVLLCKSTSNELLDFVLPPHLVKEIASQLSKSKGQLKFNLRKWGDKYQLSIPNHETVDISGYKNNFSVFNIK
jgi:hypothetical protein